MAKNQKGDNPFTEDEVKAPVTEVKEEKKEEKKEEVEAVDPRDVIIQELSRRLEALEKQSVAPSVSDVQSNGDPIHRVPVLNNKVIVDVKTVKVERQRVDGTVVLEQMYDVEFMDGERKQYTLSYYANNKTSIPVIEIEKALDGAKVKAIDYTLQRGRKVKWAGSIPEGVLGKTFFVNKSALNA